LRRAVGRLARDLGSASRTFQNIRSSAIYRARQRARSLDGTARGGARLPGRFRQEERIIAEAANCSAPARDRFAGEIAKTSLRAAATLESRGRWRCAPVASLDEPAAARLARSAPDGVHRPRARFELTIC
jgi:hypothetical protein